MIEGLNDSKKHFFVWTIVTLTLFALLFGGCYFVNKYTNVFSELFTKTEISFSVNLAFALAAYTLSTFPLGIFVRRKVMKRYVHVPTEQIKISEKNVAVAFFRLIKCQVLAIVDLVLLCFYIIASFLFGIVMFPYHVISGIVFLIGRKI